jgi:hypothetical protein
LIDTADIYAPSWTPWGTTRALVRKALDAIRRAAREELVIATKAGVTRSEGEKWGRDGSLPYLRSAVEKSLRNLGVDVIDVYQWHPPDRSITYGEGVANFKTLRDEGKVKAIGISNANVEEIEVAIDVLGPDGWSASRTSSRRSSGAARRSWSTAASAASPTCRGAPLAAPAAARVRSGTGSRCSPRSPPSTESVRSRWCWPGSCRSATTSSRFPAPGAASPITDSAKAADLVLSDEELARCSASGGSR